MSRTIYESGDIRVRKTTSIDKRECDWCEQAAVVVIPQLALQPSLCRVHLAEMRNVIDKIHDDLKEEARSMLDHPVSNPLDNPLDFWPPDTDRIAYLNRRVANRKRRNSVADQSEPIRAARAKLSAEITVDAIDELAFAWAQAVYARGGV